MEISTLVYKSDPESDALLAKTLSKAEIKATCVKSLSRMHFLLSSRRFDAIIINKKIMLDHGVSSIRHLWEFHSRLCIIMYSLTDGLIQLESQSLPVKISGKEEKIKTIESALQAINDKTEKNNPGETRQSESRMAKQSVTLAYDFPIQLHKKIRLILEVLLNAGTDGVRTDTISYAAWGNKIRDRKKDIQIYISRLRSILGTAYSGQYQIILVQDRYILIDTLQKRA